MTGGLLNRQTAKARLHSVSSSFLTPATMMRALLNGVDAGSGIISTVQGRKEAEQCLWEKKLSSVNLITRVTVCPGQTQQPNTLYLEHACKPRQKTQKPARAVQTHNSRTPQASLRDWSGFLQMRFTSN